MVALMSLAAGMLQGSEQAVEVVGAMMLVTQTQPTKEELAATD